MQLPEPFSVPLPFCPCPLGVARRAAEDRLAEDLREALRRQQLSLVVQPQLDLASGRMTAVEALLRWRHPERGWIPPSLFIPVAERTGLIHAVGRWALREACAIAAAWHARGHPLRIAVNLSTEQLASPEIAEEVEEALAVTGLPARLLVLEVTESLFLRDIDAAARRLERLRNKGVRIALDDFGDGHSGIRYLHALPLDQLKIDRCLVVDLGLGADAPPLTRAVVALGHALGLEVLAEGVEEERQLAALRRIGCDSAQGFLIGRPEPATCRTPLTPLPWHQGPVRGASNGAAVTSAAIVQAAQASRTAARMSTGDASARPSPIQASSTRRPA
jgi:EAL domain-containing protein (putative c-di-GMP-specific phosphodiesterase class I)